MPLAALLLVLGLASAVCRAAETPPEVFLGKRCAIHLSADTELAIADDNGFCSFKPAGEAKPIRFKIVPGLADTNMVSFEAADQPGFYLRHFFSRLKVDPKPPRPDPFYPGDATFEVRPSRTGMGLRLRSFNWRECYVAATFTKKAYIVPDPDPEAMALDIVY